jgi:hypothetical protein
MVKKVKIQCDFCKGKCWYWDLEYQTGKKFKAECWQCGGKGYVLATSYEE